MNAKSSVAAALLLTWLVVAPCTSLGQPSEAPATRPPPVQRSEEAADLRPVIRAKPLREGKNLVYADRSGMRLEAQVSQGRVVKWSAFDKKGQPLKTSMHKDTPSGSTVGRATCYVCVTMWNWALGTFERKCFVVDCALFIP